MTLGLSTYAPPWLKMDESRFPRACKRMAGGRLETADVISLFDGEQTNKADLTAFATLMRHLKHVDGEDHTVIMVQVENEIGLLGDSRDGSPGADKAFLEPVPDDLIEFIKSNWVTLHSDLQSNLAVASSAPDFAYGLSWEKTFGVSKQTDELFMAYHYAKYVEVIAAAGKSEYLLPMYTNVWMNYVSEDADNSFPVSITPSKCSVSQ